MKQEKPVIQHKGIFRRQITLWQAVALIVSGTIGAGVLGIPYAVAKVGLVPGLIYIVALGLLIMGLNLLLGEVTVRTKQSFQLSGLAEKYLGMWGKVVMTILFYTILVGVSVIYIIGEGDVLAELFGGSPMKWSIIFTAIASFLVLLGMRTMKTIECILTVAILLVVLIITTWSTPYIAWSTWSEFNLAQLLFPYGMILFAFHASNAIPEAHDLLKHKEVQFKKAIIYSAVIAIIVYAVFAMTVVGVSGSETTEIATVGLGEKIGPIMRVFGNIFAVLAMATSFLLVGTSLKDSLHWDYKLPRMAAFALAMGIPFAIFLAGLRHFILVMDIVGGVFISLEMILILAIYLKAKKHGDVPAGKFILRHSLALSVLLLGAFTLGAVQSVWGLF